MCVCVHLMPACMCVLLCLLVFNRCSDDYRTSQSEWSKPEQLSVVILHGTTHLYVCVCVIFVGLHCKIKGKGRVTPP